jgi:hypothetical protein
MTASARVTCIAAPGLDTAPMVPLTAAPTAAAVRSPSDSGSVYATASTTGSVAVGIAAAPLLADAVIADDSVAAAVSVRVRADAEAEADSDGVRGEEGVAGCEREADCAAVELRVGAGDGVAVRAADTDAVGAGDGVAVHAADTDAVGAGDGVAVRAAGTDAVGTGDVVALVATEAVGVRVQKCSAVFVSVTLVCVSGASAQSVTLLSVHAAASTAVVAGCGANIVRPLTTTVDELTAPAKYRPAFAMPLVAAAATASCAMLTAQSCIAGSSTCPRAATFVSDTAAPVVSVAVPSWATRTAWTAAAAPPLVAATALPSMASDPPGSMPSRKYTAVASPLPVCAAAIATPPLAATRPPTALSVLMPYAV